MNAHTYSALEFDRLISHLTGYCQTDQGREILRDLKPSSNLTLIREEIVRVEEVRGLYLRAGNFPAGGVADIRLHLKRAAVQGSVLDEAQLLAILHHLRVHAQTEKLMRREASRMPLTAALSSALQPLPALEVSLEKALTPDGTVRDAASPELARIRKAMGVQLERLRAKLMGMIPKLSRAGILREDSFSLRDGRYVLPVRADKVGSVKGIIHDRSATGGTVFIEPTALIDLGNELRTLELAERDEVRRILRMLTSHVRNDLATIEANSAIIISLDCLWAKAVFAERLEANPPTINDSGALHLYGARHPLLVLSGDRKVVPLNLDLGDSYGMLVISGPNAGGKSVALKTVGLVSLMAACGLPVPALPGTEIPLYLSIEADIGDQQSIADDLSTFTAHAGRLKEILITATPRSLVLIDEIGAGTDPQEGASLSIATLEKLITGRVPTIVTTHHGALKAFAHSADWCANGSMEFDLASFRPTYRFRPHVPGSSYALDIARRAGLPEDLIARARELVGAERSQLEELIVNLSEKLTSYSSLVADQEQRTGLIAAQETDYRQKLERLQLREKQLKQQTMQEVEELLKAARKTVEAVVRDLREHGAKAETTKTAHQTLTDLKKSISVRLDVPTLDVPQPPRHDIIAAPETKRTIDIGDWVSIDGGTSGEVTALSAKGERICLAVGAVQLWVSKERLSIIQRPDDPAEPIKNYVRLPEVPFELDVRGLDAPEALFRVEKYIYDGMSTGRSKLGIIHGKGAGVLAKFIREHLKKNKLVASYRYGEYGEGDYGVTIVELKSD